MKNIISIIILLCSFMTISNAIVDSSKVDIPEEEILSLSKLLISNKYANDYLSELNKSYQNHEDSFADWKLTYDQCRSVKNLSDEFNIIVQKIDIPFTQFTLIGGRNINSQYIPYFIAIDNDGWIYFLKGFEKNEFKKLAKYCIKGIKDETTGLEWLKVFLRCNNMYNETWKIYEQNFLLPEFISVKSKLKSFSCKKIKKGFEYSFSLYNTLSKVVFNLVCHVYENGNVTYRSQQILEESQCD